MGSRTAITWGTVVCAALVAAPADGQPERALPVAEGRPTPPAPPFPPVVVPGFGDDAPPRPGTATSTSLQLPRDTTPQPPGGQGRDPAERPQLPNTPNTPRDPAAPPQEAPRDPATPGQVRDPAARPLPPVAPAETLPPGSALTLPDAAEQVIRFGPRYGTLNNAKSEPIPGEKDGTRVTYLGGLIVSVQYREASGVRNVQFEADNVVMWVRGVNSDVDLTQQLRVERPKPAGEKKDGEKDGGGEKRKRVEMYLSGNVVIRTRTDETSQGAAEQTLRAEEIFYDVENSRAIALAANLETKFATGFDSIFIRGREVWQLGRHEFRMFDALTYSSKLPADPQLTLATAEATLTEQNTVRRNVFGRPYRNARTGEPDVGFERKLVATDNTLRLGGVPVGYFPRYTADLDDPSGPLSGIGFRSDRVFGRFQVYTSFDLFKLLGLRGAPGNSWSLNLDYLSDRGPGLGTDFFYRDLFGSAYKNAGFVSLYGLHDKRDEDVLGGFRGPEPGKPDFRGRAIWQHNQDLFESGTSFTRFTGQFSYLSDKNFFEQFYKLRFDNDPNQETFAYLYGAVGNFAWSGLGEVNVNRPWVTETQWLPRLNAALVGESFLDTLVYTARASAGYAQFRPASQSPFSDLPQERANQDTLRADLYQRLSLPFDAGPVRLEPYGVMDLTAYSQDYTGDGRGRFYGGGGVKASVPFSRLYRDVENELLNVRGLYHKVELTANYFVAQSDTDPTRLPLLDRLNDDASDLSYRSWRRFGGLYSAPGTNGALLRDTPRGQALAFSPIFDPVLLANRRLLQTNPEVLNDMQVVQGGIRQRWQTKRGPEGRDHTVDWMTLDLSASFFPDKARDNFGESFGQFEYNYLWNVGDRTAFSSSGWFDPYSNGTRYFNLGVFYNRPDGTNVYVGYRHTDPIGSRVFLAVLGYQFSRKYSVSVTNAFDLSNNFAQSTSIAFNRTGTDVTMSLGLSYNAFQNNLGLQFLLIPNVALANTPNRGVRNLFQQ